jgi:hypothetical protein
MLKAIVPFMQATEAGGKTFGSWSASVVASIRSKVGPEVQEVIQVLRAYSESCTAFTAEMAKCCEASEWEGTEALRDKLLALSKSTLPNVFNAANADFSRGLLINQAFFQLKCGPAFLPNPDRAADGNVVPHFFWRAVAGFAIPITFYETLADIDAIAPEVHADFVKCRKAFLKVQLQVAIAKFRHQLAEFASQAGVGGETDTPAAQMEVASQLQECVKCVTDALMASGHVADEAIQTMKAYVQQQVVDVYWQEIMKLLPLLTTAVSKIPNNYENLISNKSVNSIRGELFDREKHTAVCGNIDAIDRLLKIITVITYTWSDAGLISGQQLAKIKQTETQHKVLKTYSVSIHGLNLILHRMPNKGSREKAGYVRELLGLFIERGLGGCHYRGRTFNHCRII